MKIKKNILPLLMWILSPCCSFLLFSVLILVAWQNKEPIRDTFKDFYSDFFRFKK